MRVSFLLFVVCWSQEVVTKCQQKARNNAARNIKICKSRAIARIVGRGKNLVTYREELKEIQRQQNDLKHELCDKVEQIYEPNGLAGQIPPSWGCEVDGMVMEVLAKLKNQHLNVAEDAYNIALVGRTGAGKSYFGNALLGHLEPGRERDVPFPAKATDFSVTQNIYAQTGFLFGGLYDDELGLSGPIKINVFDTPGFADAEITNIRKNKLLIASSLKQNIDMIIFVSPNPRFDQNNQDALEMLNEWTTGNIWDNLIIAKSRTLFDEHSVNERQDNQNYMAKIKNNKKIVDFLMKRQAADPGKAWEKTELVGDVKTTTPLTAQDFKNLEISLINMAQHRECYESDTRNRSAECWQLPLYDERDQYEMAYDSYTFEESVTYSDQYVFIEEAKILANRLKEMANHPIIPSANLFQFDLSQDIAAFDALQNREQDLDTQMTAMATNPHEMEQANKECEKNVIDEVNCPIFGEWGEWTQCAGCGESASKARLRTGCIANGTDVDMTVCELDTMTSRREEDKCEANPCSKPAQEFNNVNMVFFELIKQQTQGLRELRKYNQYMVSNLMKHMVESRTATQMQFPELLQNLKNENAIFRMANEENQKEILSSILKVVNDAKGGCLSTTDSAMSCEDEGFNLIYLKDLKRNDKVWSYEPRQQKFVCTRVIAQHAEAREVMHFFTFKLDDDFESTVRLTGDHLIYILAKNKIILKPANSVKVGDVLITKFGNFRVQIIQDDLQYPVSPQTENGIIVVNGMVVSTLTIRHGKLGPLLLKVADKIMTSAGVNEEKEANKFFTELVDKTSPHLPVYNRGTKMFEAILALLKENQLEIDIEDSIKSQLLDLDEELNMEL